ncbi:transposase, IS30 family [Corynebacterium epidermidicanis]|uniref:Transposase, IS30 family n=1 Tax=Corynebacterium epidermidicanis TaxID=1050174 RepID=A0A0G3GLQ9_9CORY|nr:transposase, IS30 family [Corynebacterium epidermidicanis]AKK02185.1 transposase, IS30 family [Corynebacterium epidermidicanis]AKK03815.1 transposase, IS30 family [Corynebacterium epidermidicanis]
MDIVRHCQLGSSVVYRVGIDLGLWTRNPHGRRAAATSRRCAYLQLRIGALGRKDAADACGIHLRDARDIDKGVIKVGRQRVAFIPDGPDAALYNRLMQLLDYVDGRQSLPIAIVPQSRIDQRISPRYLCIEERELIFDLHRQGFGVRAIARRLGRAPSTISKELRRNQDDFGLYLPTHAQRTSTLRRFRPKKRKIDLVPGLWETIFAMLRDKLSPEQIAGRLRKDYPDDDTMHVCAETIYQALFFQAKGELKKEIAACLRQGRTVRKPRGQRIPRRRFVDPMVMISDRPADVEDRAVPGHWEGDLILGKGNTSAIGTLVERSTRYVMLLHLPDGHDAVAVRNALVTAINGLPEHLKGSLTWDQGSEMAGHKSFTIATDCPVYFCDPASPWQRGSNENTNGLLRQYFPKGTDLSVHTAEDLEFVAMQLNRRPRKTLNFDTPAERMAQLLDKET